ncbi:MAG TPA: hypothetical protein VEA15_01725 [Caulobacteraceae bacterium]|nr:hypothetical protein [Caulobacteraceae bacterium]
MRALLFAGALIAAAAAASTASACREYVGPRPYVAAEPSPDEWDFVYKAARASYPEIRTTAKSCTGLSVPGTLVAGYKAGLTTAAAQARFGTDRPLLGVLFFDMLLESGASVPGERPGTRWEADFLLVVGDARINAARTREQALAGLRGYRPFIEIPVLPSAEGRALAAADLAAVNVGAWRGVFGDERPLSANALTSLADMRVRAFDGSGALLAEGKGSDALGHPLDVVLWVKDQVLAQGGRLRPGDIISVGAFTPLTPPKAGQTIRVRYEGLPDDPEVSVRFR